MNYQSTEVYRYLIYLQKYLLGDLELFHKNAQDAEGKEREQQVQPQNVIPVHTSPGDVEPTTTTTTVTTTQYPYSYEFIFGATVISRATIPNTAALFSVVDILGFLTRTGVNYGSTIDNFNEFFAYPSTTLRDGELPVLLNVYRHGMAHNYLPKLHVQVSYHSTNPDDKMFFKDALGNLVLNVNKLEEIVVKRLNEIISNSELYARMNAQLTIMISSYQTQSGPSIATLLATL